MAISFAVMFADMGKLIYAAKTLNVARETTVDAEVEDCTDRIDTGITPLNSLQRGEIFGPLSAALLDWQDGSDALMEAIRDAATRLVIAHVDYDASFSVVTIEDAIREIVRQLYDASETITAATSPTEAQTDTTDGGGARSGNGVLAFSTKNADGRASQFYVSAEHVVFRCSSASIDSPGDESWTVTGRPVASPMSGRYPDGIGINTNITTTGVESTSNIIENGSFEEADANDTSMPDGWLEGATAAALASWVLTDIETQTITITGTPTTGSYTVTLTNYPVSGETQVTEPVAYDATAADLQAALQRLVGLEDVTVSTSGTSPDYTHTISFVKVRNPGAITVAATFQRNEVQTLASSHTAGTTGTITFDGQTTGNIAYNASAATIQTALEALSNVAPGDIVCTGGPLGTDNVTMTFGGAYLYRAVVLMTFNIGNYTGGVATLVETTNGRGAYVTAGTAGSAHSYQYARCLDYTGDGSTTGEFICQRLDDLQPLTQYGFAVSLKVSSGPASGVLKARLVTAPGGTIIDDEAGNDNDITMTLSSSSPTTETIYTGFFRTPRVLPETIYLSLNMTTFLSNTVHLYVDNVILTPVEVLTPEGFSGFIVGGNERWVEGDQVTVSWSGGMGEIQDWFNRFFGTAQMGYTIPSSGSPTYADGTYIT